MAIHLTARFSPPSALPNGQQSASHLYGFVHSKGPRYSNSLFPPARLLASQKFRQRGGTRVRANVLPGFVRPPSTTDSEQAKALGISEEDVIKNVMLKETVDGEFTTVEDVAETALFLAAFRTNALTGQSIIVSHGWFME